MKLVFNLNEGLNPREKQIYIDAINDDCEDIEDLKEVVHEIYWYDKGLFAQINKFPKDASFEDIKANILKHLGENMDESMSLQRDRFDSVEDYLEKNTESFSVNNGTITLDEPGEVNKALKILKKYYDDVDYSVESDALGDPYWNISFADPKDDNLNEAYAKASADLAKDYVDYLEKYAVKIPGEPLADYDMIVSDIDDGYIDALELGIEDIINSPQYNMAPGVDVQEAIREGKDLINRLYSAYSANFVGYGGYHGYGESLKESATGYYKLCVYIPDSGGNGMMGDYSDTYEVIKAFDAKDAMEKFEKQLRSEADETELARLNYFKNFHDFLVDSNMYIDDATEDEYKQFHSELEESAADISPEQRVADWKRAVQICKAYDPFTSYIDNYSQQKSAEAVNKDLTDEFVAIMKNHGIECNSIPLSCVNKSSLSEVSKALKAWVEAKAPEQPLAEWYVAEDTVKTKDGKWTNKGDEGTHGKFNTKKEADAQRKAMFANGYHEDLADKFLRIHDKDEYNWNLHNTDYTKFYDILKRYMKPGETWDEDDEEGYPLDTNVKLDTLFRRMPKSEQRKFMKEFDLHGAYDESLKESAAMDTAKKLEDDGWTVLSNGIRGGDTKYYWLARRMNKERGKADWKAIDDETGNVIDISYDQALGREPIGVSSGVSKLSKQLGKMLLPNNESLEEGDYDRPGFEDMYLVCWDDQLGDYHEAKVKASYPQDAIDKVSKRKNVYKIIDCKKIDMFVSPARIRKAEVVESLKESSPSLKQEIYDLLNDMGGYTDYQGRIDAVAEQFGISKDEAEGYVCNWIQFYDEEPDIDESLKESAVWVDSNGKEIKRRMSSFGEPNVDYSLNLKQAKDYKEKQNIIRNLIQTYDQVEIQGMSPKVALIRDNNGNTVYRFDFLEKDKAFEDQIAEFKSLVDESLKEDIPYVRSETTSLSFDNDFINYNDFLADNFDGWSDDIDFLMKDLNKCARALRTSASKLVFYKDYDEDFYAVDDIANVVNYVAEDYSMYELSGTGIRFIVCNDFSSSFWIFRNEEDGNRVVNSVKSYVKSLNENFKLEGLVDITDDFREARNNWSKIIPDVDFDIALERWNKESKLADPDWYAKPIYSVAAWEDMVQMFKPNDIEDVPEPEDLELAEPEEEVAEPSDDDFQLEDDENSAP